MEEAKAAFVITTTVMLFLTALVGLGAVDDANTRANERHCAAMCRENVRTVAREQSICRCTEKM